MSRCFAPREIRWSPDIVHHIREENASVALRVAKSIHESVVMLKRFPRLGRPGRMEETRELVRELRNLVQAAGRNEVSFDLEFANRTLREVVKAEQRPG